MGKTEIKMKITLSPEGKLFYLNRFYNEVIKVLYVIEEEQQTKTIDAQDFIYGLLFELSSANEMMDGALTKALIKLNGIYKTYKTEKFSVIRKQVFEIRGIIKYIRDGGEEEGK